MASRRAAAEKQCKDCGARDARKGEEESGMKERKEIPKLNKNSSHSKLWDVRKHMRAVISEEQ